MIFAGCIINPQEIAWCQYCTNPFLDSGRRNRSDFCHVMIKFTKHWFTPECFTSCVLCWKTTPAKNVLLFINILYIYNILYNFNCYTNVHVYIFMLSLSIVIQNNVLCFSMVVALFIYRQKGCDVPKCYKVAKVM